jgi:hypothetical protein
VLAETFNICEPDKESLVAEALNDTELFKSLICSKTIKDQYKYGEEKNNSYIEDLIKKHDKFDIRKIDLLKISAIEILMSLITFSSLSSMRGFMLCHE